MCLSRPSLGFVTDCCTVSTTHLVVGSHDILVQVLMKLIKSFWDL